MADTAEATPTVPSPKGNGEQAGDLRSQIEDMLRTCRDPEIGLDIMSLGLVYEMNIDDGGDVLIKMTLTAIGCPWAQDLFDEVKMKVEEVPGVTSCTVELVYSPPWSADMMSEEAKMELGFL
jgi:metal-sulfur cluster biosynthetic enzyme